MSNDAADQPRTTEGRSSPHLPVTRLELFATGVAYVEHQGFVDGSATWEIDVPRGDMDDLLQSVVLQDRDGGRIGPIRYEGDATDALSTRRSTRRPADEHPTFASLLEAARGESVTVTTKTPHHGILVGLERETSKDSAVRSWIVLTGSTGLRRFDLDEVTALGFDRAEVGDAHVAALAAATRDREETAVTVRFGFHGEGRRRIRVGYLRSMPTWKPSYRLLLGDGGAELQGWAIIDNPGDGDLLDVDLTLVAGAPSSFVNELYRPLHIERPRAEPHEDGAQSPRLTIANRLWHANSFDADVQVSQYRTEPMGSPGQGVEQIAAPSERTATFSYRIMQPVTMRGGESAAVPFVVTRIEAHPISVFDGARPQVRHPQRAVRLVNDIGLHLARGPVAVFDHDGFTGMAELDELVPGDDTILTYATDLDIAVEADHHHHDRDEATMVRFADGTLASERRSRRTTHYRVEAKRALSRFLIIRHPRPFGHELLTPAPADLVNDAYRFGVLVEAEDGSALDPDPSVVTHLRMRDAGVLEVTTERVETRHLQLEDLTAATALELLDVERPDRATRAALEPVLACLLELEQLDQEDARLATRHREIVTAQERLRGNMAVLGHDSDLYRRYLDQFAVQEDELTELEQARAAGESRRAKVRMELAALTRQPRSESDGGG
jgi:hypothetical protein